MGSLVLASFVRTKSRREMGWASEYVVLPDPEQRLDLEDGAEDVSVLVPALELEGKRLPGLESSLKKTNASCSAKTWSLQPNHHFYCYQQISTQSKGETRGGA